MKINSKETNDILFLEILGEIDLYNTKEINELFENMITEKKLRIIIDLQNVPFIDSSGFVGFVAWTKKFKLANGNLAFLNVSSFISKIIEQNSMGTLLNIFDSQEAAIQSFEK